MENKDKILLEQAYQKILENRYASQHPEDYDEDEDEAKEIKKEEARRKYEKAEKAPWDDGSEEDEEEDEDTKEESVKKTSKVINEGLLPKGIQTVRGWIEEFGAQEAAHKCISKCVEKVAGLSVDDLPDTSTLANGFEAVSEIFEQSDLSDQDIQDAWKIAKDTAREMLEDEGFYGESTKIPHGIQPISEAKKKVNPWAVEKSIEKKTGKKFGKKHKEEIIKGIKKSAKKAGKKITSEPVKSKKKVVKEGHLETINNLPAMFSLAAAAGVTGLVAYLKSLKNDAIEELGKNPNFIMALEKLKQTQEKINTAKQAGDRETELSQSELHERIVQNIKTYIKKLPKILQQGVIKKALDKHGL